MINYPIKYRIIPVISKNFNGTYIAAYIPIKTYIVKEVRTYLDNGEVDSYFGVVDTYTINDLNFYSQNIPEIDFDKDYKNMKFVENASSLYDSYEEAASITKNLNAENLENLIAFIVPSNPYCEILKRKYKKDVDKYSKFAKMIDDITCQLKVSDDSDMYLNRKQIQKIKNK